MGHLTFKCITDKACVCMVLVAYPCKQSHILSHVTKSENSPRLGVPGRDAINTQLAVSYLSGPGPAKSSQGDFIRYGCTARSNSAWNIDALTDLLISRPTATLSKQAPSVGQPYSAPSHVQPHSVLNCIASIFLRKDPAPSGSHSLSAFKSIDAIEISNAVCQSNAAFNYFFLLRC